MATPRSTFTINAAKPLPHTGAGIAPFYSMHFLAGVLPLTAGVIFYGWRAAWVVAIVIISTSAGVSIWRRVGARGKQLRQSQAIWFAGLLGVMLPAHLATTIPSDYSPIHAAPWPILPAAGLLLAMAMWTLGGVGARRFGAPVVVYLLIALLFGGMLTAQRILQRQHIVAGDLFDAVRGDSANTSAGARPWAFRVKTPGGDALLLEPSARRLLAYTQGASEPDHGLLRLQGMLRDQMPPLEDLIVGGQPGPIGAGCAIAAIVGGLFLLYRGLIDYRVPMIATVTAFAAFLVLPVPARIAEHPQYRWLAMREGDVGWPTAVTFANYELMAAPLFFAVFFLATSTNLCPISRRARMLYALILGITSAGFQLYVSVSLGPYLGVLAAGIIAPELDKWFRPRQLV
jgi:Na+-translocating ferredoxin:NAD+ oxidoreductase RnfD subunit